jgi:hypothetical protein
MVGVGGNIGEVYFGGSSILEKVASISASEPGMVKLYLVSLSMITFMRLPSLSRTVRWSSSQLLSGDMVRVTMSPLEALDREDITSIPYRSEIVEIFDFGAAFLLSGDTGKGSKMSYD